jgi:endonuclease-8
MPEGDTIFRTAASLHRALAGRQVTGFATALAQLARVDDDTPIVGRTIERCESRGKHVLLAFSGDLVLRTHMRMSGSWHLYRPGEAWKRTQTAMRVHIVTNAWVAVAFDVPVADFVRTKDLARDRALRSLGPDLLSSSFDRAAALARLAAAGLRPIADVLLDQRVVAGIGNIFKSEVLFLGGVHPDTPAGSLDAATLARVLDVAVPLMQSNTRPGEGGSGGQITTYRGLRRPTRHDAVGDRLWVYGRAGRPCRKCGTPIRSKQTGPDARRTYWCPACQTAR